MRYQRLLARHEVRQLMLASFLRGRTALELSEGTGIPIARCYRLLWKLRAAGLMHVEGAYVSARGRTKLRFRARLEGLELFLRDNHLMARIRRSRVLGSSRG